MMELVYLWLEEYKNIHKQEFNFSSKFECKYDEKNNELTIDENDDYIENFFGENIDELYKQHKDIVIDLLIKKIYYPKSYIKELKDNFEFTQDEIYSYLLCNYSKEEDLHKRPLSKLIKDISEELELV